MKLIVLTPSDKIANEVAIIHQLFNDGLMKLHIRKPNCSCDEVRQFIQQINTVFHAKIVLHQYPELLQEFNLAGFHITQYYKQHIDAIKNKILPHQSLSISCHSFDEIQQYDEFDYYFISPIFNSISKANYKSNFSTTEIEAGLANNAAKKIIALGGIHADNIGMIKKMQFSGAAILGGLWQADNTIAEWKKISNII